jgi:hypothetical protein
VVVTDDGKQDTKRRDPVDRPPRTEKDSSGKETQASVAHQRLPGVVVER